MRNRIAKDGGKSERAGSTSETGEPTQGTPSREDARRSTEPLGGKAPGLLAGLSVATKLERIATRARERRQEVITNVNHLFDAEWLEEAHRLVRKDVASGVDGMTAAAYAVNLDQNLAALLKRFRSRTYRAPPVRRVHIPKGDGSKTRPIGIPTFEDKVLQRAVAMFLNAVYEQEFRNCSYGYRPGRSCHDALDALRGGLMKMHGGFVLEFDIKGFFDSLVHEHLKSFLDLRVRDGVVRQAIGSWLKAGVLEDGLITRADEGTPQGGVVSPILANIFLHHVLDVWFEDEIRPRLSGEAFLVRYADDGVIAFENKEDARRVLDVLSKRFEKFGLTLHPDKTQLVRFKRPKMRTEGKGRDEDGEGPGTFGLLGFTHYWGVTRNGGWAIMWATKAKKLHATLQEISSWCKSARHWPVREQHQKLCDKLKGHDGYFGVPGNYRNLAAVRRAVERIWRYWLHRRGQKRAMPWDRFKKLLELLPLPPPRLATRYSAAKP